MSLTHIGDNTKKQPNIILGALGPDKYLDLQHLFLNVVIVIQHIPCYVISKSD